MILREISGPDLLSGLFCSEKSAVFFSAKSVVFSSKTKIFREPGICVRTPRPAYSMLFSDSVMLMR